MKGSRIVLRRGEVEVSTQFLTPDKVEWPEGEPRFYDKLLTQGWVPQEDYRRQTLKLAEDLWSKFCYRRSDVTNAELMELIKRLRGEE